MLPHIANFDDFDPLRFEPEVQLEFIAPGSAAAARCGPHHPARQQGDDRGSRVLPRAGLAHRPAGARAPRRARARHLRRLSDARQRSSTIRSASKGRASCAGLDLLDVRSTMTEHKTLRAVSGVELATGARIAGYEMHLGATERTRRVPTDDPLRRRHARRCRIARTAASPAATCTDCSPNRPSAPRTWRRSAHAAPGEDHAQRVDRRARRDRSRTRIHARNRAPVAACLGALSSAT